MSHRVAAFTINGNKQHEGLREQAIRFFMAIFIALYSLFCAVTNQLPRKQAENVVEQNVDGISFSSNSIPAEIRPPSPTPTYSEASLSSSILKRLGELEEKVNILESRPSVMPYEKEEILNASVYRVDALEAELIATKKVI